MFDLPHGYSFRLLRAVDEYLARKLGLGPVPSWGRAPSDPFVPAWPERQACCDPFIAAGEDTVAHLEGPTHVARLFQVDARHLLGAASAYEVALWEDEWTTTPRVPDGWEEWALVLGPGLLDAWIYDEAKDRARSLPPELDLGARLGVAAGRALRAAVAGKARFDDGSGLAVEPDADGAVGISFHEERVAERRKEWVAYRLGHAWFIPDQARDLPRRYGSVIRGMLLVDGAPVFIPYGDYFPLLHAELPPLDLFTRWQLVNPTARTVVRLLSDSDPRVRQWAMLALPVLGRLGGLSHRSLPAGATGD